MRLAELESKLREMFPDHEIVIGIKTPEQLRADARKIVSVWIERETVDRTNTRTEYIIVVAHKRKLNEFDSFQTEVDQMLIKLYSLPLTNFAIEYANNDVYLFAIIRAEGRRRIL